MGGQRLLAMLLAAALLLGGCGGSGSDETENRDPEEASWERRILGGWHGDETVGAGYADRFWFDGAGIYAYAAPRPADGQRVRMTAGSWWVEDDVLYLSADCMLLAEGGEAAEGTGSVIGGISGEQGVYRWLSAAERVVEAYPLGWREGADGAYGGVSLDGEDYWRVPAAYEELHAFLKRREADEPDEEAPWPYEDWSGALPGGWHGDNAVGAGYAERYWFEADGRFAWAENQMLGTQRLRYSAGGWWLEGDVLCLSADRLLAVEGGEVVEEPLASSWGMIDGGTLVYREIPEAERQTERYLLSMLEAEGGVREGIRLGDAPLWAYSQDYFPDVIDFLEGVDFWTGEETGNEWNLDPGAWDPQPENFIYDGDHPDSAEKADNYEILEHWVAAYRAGAPAQLYIQDGVLNATYRVTSGGGAAYLLEANYNQATSKRAVLKPVACTPQEAAFSGHCFHCIVKRAQGAPAGFASCLKMENHFQVV